MNRRKNRTLHRTEDKQTDGQTNKQESNPEKRGSICKIVSAFELVKLSELVPTDLQISVFVEPNVFLFIKRFSRGDTVYLINIRKSPWKQLNS